jgi:steroid delta-isomerase-like uncharacterized protein
MSPQAGFFTRFGDTWQTGKVEIVDELFPADLDYHLAPFPDLDRDGLKQFITAFHQAFPDFLLTVHEETTSGDTTTARWSCAATFTGQSPLLPVAPTGRRTEASGTHVMHWRDGRPVEVWHHGDWLGWLQRCGALPPLDARAARERTVREHMDAENRHDPDATVATFSRARAAYDIPAFGEAGEVPDHDSVRELFVGMFSVFPDFHVVPGPLRHGDDHVAVEVRMTGTQHADWAGIPSTGRAFDTRVAVLFEFEGDDLVCERVYLDLGEMARQLTGA